MREHVERLRRLGDAARESQAIAEEDRQARDAAIEAASLDNMSSRDIARHVGLRPSSVHHIIVTRTAARQARLLRATGVAN